MQLAYYAAVTELFIHDDLRQWLYLWTAWILNMDTLTF